MSRAERENIDLDDYLKQVLVGNILIQSLFIGLFLCFITIFNSVKMEDLLLIWPNINNDILILSFIPVMYYSNGDTDKFKIITNNKGKAGVYQWIHKELNKSYVGSAFDLSKRLSSYYSITYLTRPGKSYINNALIKDGYSAFSLTILEYIDISNLNKDDAKKLILSREQYYIDALKPEYNILSTAGSSLGYKHSEESLELMRSALKGRSFTETHKEKLSTAKKGTTFTKAHKANMSKKVYVYTNDNPKTLFKLFNSCNETAKYFNCNRRTIYNYLDKNKIFQKKWFLSSNEIDNL